MNESELKEKIRETTTGGADRASGPDLDTVAVDVGGRTGIGEGGVVEADEPVTTNTTDEGEAIEDDIRDERERISHD